MCIVSSRCSSCKCFGTHYFNYKRRISLLRIFKSPKKGEKDNFTNYEPTILRIGRRIGIGPCCEPTILRIRDLEIGYVSLYPRCRPPFLRPIRSNKNQRFGHQFRDLKKSEKWVSIILKEIKPIKRWKFREKARAPKIFTFRRDKTYFCAKKILSLSTSSKSRPFCLKFQGWP